VDVVKKPCYSFCVIQKCVALLSGILLSVILLNVIMLTAIMLIVLEMHVLKLTVILTYSQNVCHSARYHSLGCRSPKCRYAERFGA
jgi:hypothetical protein